MVKTTLGASVLLPLWPARSTTSRIIYFINLLFIGRAEPFSDNCNADATATTRAKGKISSPPASPRFASTAELYRLCLCHQSISAGDFAEWNGILHQHSTERKINTKALRHQLWSGAFFAFQQSLEVLNVSILDKQVHHRNLSSFVYLCSRNRFHSAALAHSNKCAIKMGGRKIVW